MIEKTVLDHMNDELSIPVYMEKPTSAPSEYVLAEKTGSSRENLICKGTFAFQSYANSLYRAAEINEAVKAAADSLIEESTISFSQLNSDYNFTDTTKKQYRYQAVYDITYKE